MKSYSADAIASAVKAVQFGDLVTVRMLLVSGQVSASSVDNDGCSLLHWAAINNRVAITNLLIQNGAVVPCAGGVLAESPLHWAVRRGFLRITDLLLNNGADLTYRSSLGLDVLNLSTRLGLLNTVFYLLAKGADPDSRPPDGDSPLLWCLKNRSSVPPDLVRLLLRQGADPCVPDNDGNTAYHVLAAANEEIDSTVWAALYAAGAQKAFWVRNKEGRYPYQV
jgi:ankyrin repeat protein